MADNFTVLNYTSSTVTFRSTDVGSGIQNMMSIPTNPSGTAMLGQQIMASSLPVAIASNQSAVPISGTVTAIISGAGTTSVNITQVGGTAISIGQAVMATSFPVVIASNQSNVPVNLGAINGTTINIGQAIMATSIPVVIASNQSSLTAVVSGTVTAVVNNPITAVVSGTVTAVVNNPITAVVSGTVTGIVSGDIATAVADAGNPVKIGAVAHTAAPTAVGEGQRVNIIADKVGKLIAVGGIRQLMFTQTATLNAASETAVIPALNATTFADIYGLILANTGSTTSKVDFRSGIGSTIIMTFEVPTLDTRGFMLPVDSAIPQPTANFTWSAQLTSTTTMNVTAFYVKNI